ncbi:MAG: proteasome beta subunit, partial [Natronomonas sp.]
MQDNDITPPRHPAAAKFDHGPYEPELESLPTYEGDRERDDGTVNKTGTTTIGIAVDDGVVVATDMRASLGGRFVSNKNVQKVEQIHPTAALTLVGSVGGAQSFIRTLR